MNKYLLVLLAFSFLGCQSTPPKAAPPGFDARLSGYAYPRPVQIFKFESQRQSLEMAYLLAEPAQPNGKTVVLLHGKNFGAWFWESTIAALTERGYRVIAPDQIGFGKSSKPAAYQFTFQGLAENTRALLDHLKVERFVLVGHSMGGMLATRLALMYPARVEKLVLVNPIGLEDWKLKVPYRTVEQVYANELAQNADKIREYQRQTYFAGQWKPEYDALLVAATGWTQHPDFPLVAWNSALTADMIFTQPVVYEFSRLKMPTLLLIGTRDRTAIGKERVPEEARRELGNYEKLGKYTARAIPKAKLVELKDVDVPQIEVFPEYMAALLSYLNE